MAFLEKSLVSRYEVTHVLSSFEDVGSVRGILLRLSVARDDRVDPRFARLFFRRQLDFNRVDQFACRFGYSLRGVSVLELFVI